MEVLTEFLCLTRFEGFLMFSKLEIKISKLFSIAESTGFTGYLEFPNWRCALPSIECKMVYDISRNNLEIFIRSRWWALPIKLWGEITRERFLRGIDIFLLQLTIDRPNPLRNWESPQIGESFSTNPDKINRSMDQNTIISQKTFTFKI